MDDRPLSIARLTKNFAVGSWTLLYSVSFAPLAYSICVSLLPAKRVEVAPRLLEGGMLIVGCK